MDIIQKHIETVILENGRKYGCYDVTEKKILHFICKTAKEAKLDPELGEDNTIYIGTDVDGDMDIIQNQYVSTDDEFKELAKEIFETFLKNEFDEIVSVAYYNCYCGIDTDNEYGFSIIDGKILVCVD